MSKFSQNLKIKFSSIDQLGPNPEIFKLNTKINFRLNQLFLTYLKNAKNVLATFIQFYLFFFIS